MSLAAYVMSAVKHTSGWKWDKHICKQTRPLLLEVYVLENVLQIQSCVYYVPLARFVCVCARVGGHLPGAGNKTHLMFISTQPTDYKDPSYQPLFTRLFHQLDSGFCGRLVLREGFVLLDYFIATLLPAPSPVCSTSPSTPA